MKKRHYVDMYDYSHQKVNSLLSSPNIDDKIDGLLKTVLGSNDYDKSVAAINSSIKLEDPTMQQTALSAIGHLARIYGKIEKEYLHLINGMLIREEDKYTDYVFYALSDIWIFCDRKVIKSGEFEIIDKYFSVLEIADLSKIDEEYNEGIIKIGGLIKNENNPAILQAGKSAIELLKNLSEAK